MNITDIESQKPEYETQIDLSIFDATQINKMLYVALNVAAENYVDALRTDLNEIGQICPLFGEEINECVDNYSCGDENVGFSKYDCWRKQFIKDALNYIWRIE